MITMGPYGALFCDFLLTKLIAIVGNVLALFSAQLVFPLSLAAILSYKDEFESENKNRRSKPARANQF